MRKTGRLIFGETPARERRSFVFMVQFMTVKEQNRHVMDL
jgi:hypothetical protein